jgi:hypothetical protein
LEHVECDIQKRNIKRQRQKEITEEEIFIAGGGARFWGCHEYKEQVI